MTRIGSTVAVALLLSVTVHAAGAPQQDGTASDIEKLRDDLARPGADGREARETAVERLLAMPDAEAHRVLSQALARQEDPDALRMTILRALGRHLMQTDSMQFGGAPTAVRRQIFNYYLGTLSEWWRDGRPPVPEPLQQQAREALIRVPVRELEASARLLLETDNVDGPALFDCIADLQNLYLGQVLARHVEDDDPKLRAAARGALRTLTFREADFETQAQFAQWFEKNADVRYVDLAERAARQGSERVAGVLKELEAARIARSRDVVRAYADAGPGINWEAIRRETLVSDHVLLEACLEALRDELADRMPLATSSPRQLFCRALLDRWQQTPVTATARRSLLLEVAAYTVRPEEADLAGDIQAGLLAQLARDTVGEQLAALRGLRRFPSVSARSVIVSYARSAVDEGAAAMARIETALATLGSRAAPRWLAPAPADPDKDAWIDLIRAIWQRPDLARLRDQALALALSPATVTADGSEIRVPEVFGMLLEFAQDTTQDSHFRSTCVIWLRSWDFPPGAEKRLKALHALLADPEPELRQQAARSLGKLVKSDPESTIAALRARLPVEPTGGVLDALAQAMVVCGSEPDMPEPAIGAIIGVLANLRKDGAIPAAHEFRVEPLLSALFQIASSDNAANGPWLAACEELLEFKKRQSLRHLLGKRHAAVDMATGVTSNDVSVANRSRRAMQILIRTALLKRPDQPWTGSPDLAAEANAVRIAFGALDDPKVPDSARLDDPQHRLLRLEVALAGAHYREVVDRATALLADTNPNPAPGGAARKPFSAEQKDQIRVLAADGYLGLSDPAAAARMLAGLGTNRPLDSAQLAVFDRVGKALAKSTANGDAATAVHLFDQARKATPVEDPAFRERLMDWATTSVRVHPESRPAVWAEVQQHSAIFEAQDCPGHLRTKFAGLRGDNPGG